MDNSISVNTLELAPSQPSWQKQLAQAVTNPTDLLKLLKLDENEFKTCLQARKQFPMRVPLPFINRMKVGDPKDPLLLQVLPSELEMLQQPGFSADPLQEQNNQTPGLLHKYKSRVLVVFRSGCAVNCRYCFRRHFPYQQNNINKQKLQQILTYISTKPEINEVILSGGDPLMASDEHIHWFLTKLEAIEHIKRFRIHTRLPVVIPARLTSALLHRLTQTRLKSVIVLHINHSNEIDHHLKEQLKPFIQSDITLLNQAVLLKDINDSVQAQIELSEQLHDAGILPYYLHLLDKVEGASHFEVSEQQGRQIMTELLKELPGFLIPKLVREQAEQPSKTPINL